MVWRSDRRDNNANASGMLFLNLKEALCKYFVSATYLGAVSVLPPRMTWRPKCRVRRKVGRACVGGPPTFVVLGSLGTPVSMDRTRRRSCRIPAVLLEHAAQPDSPILCIFPLAFNFLITVKIKQLLFHRQCAIIPRYVLSPCHLASLTFGSASICAATSGGLRPNGARITQSRTRDASQT